MSEDTNTAPNNPEQVRRTGKSGRTIQPPPQKAQANDVHADAAAEQPAPGPQPNTTTIPHQQTAAPAEPTNTAPSVPPPPESPAPGSAAPQMSVLPPQSHLNTLDQSKNSSSKRGSGSRRTFLIVGLVLLLVLLLSIGGYVVYAQYVAPQRAPLGYMQRLSNAKTFTYDFRVDTDADDVSVTGSASGALDRSDPENGKFSSDIKAEIDNANGFGFTIELELIGIEDTLYIKPHQLGFLSLFFGAQPESEAWFKTELDEGAINEYTNRGCSEADRQAVAEYLKTDAYQALEIINPQRVDWFGEEVAGHRTRHYRGTIPGSVFATISQDVRERVSEDCQALQLDETDLENYRLSYDLWQGDNFDRITAVLHKGEEQLSELTLTTQDYDQDVQIERPANVTPIEELFGGTNAALSGQNSGAARQTTVER